MFEYKVVLGLLAVLVGLISYIPYFRDILAHKTKPHMYTWFVWALLTTIAFFAQVVDGGGPGAWVTGTTAFISFIIFGFAVQRGEKNITKSDTLSLVGVAISLLLWYLTKDPLLSVVLITLIDALAFYPTIRKSIMKPHEETASTYILAGIKFMLALIALEHYSVVTYLYPLSLVVMNLLFVVLLYVRRSQLGKKKN